MNLLLCLLPFAVPSVAADRTAYNELVEYELGLRPPAAELHSGASRAGGPTARPGREAPSLAVREPRSAPVPPPDGERRGFERGFEAVREATDSMLDACDGIGPMVFFPPILLTAFAVIFVMRGAAIMAGAATALVDLFRD